MRLEFETRTGKVVIDYDRCNNCLSFACVKACSLYGRGLFRIEEGRLALKISDEEARRQCIECLACENDCHHDGNGALRIDLPLLGLEEYRRKVGFGSERRE